MTVELSEQDADLWDAFRRGGEWVNASEYRKLMAQNAKLREEIEAAKHDLQVFSMGSVQLEADNDTLRELVKRMFDRVNYECRCCSVFCSDWDEDNECCVFTTLMRELGVDEC